MSQALVALRKDALLQWRTRGRFVAVFIDGPPHDYSDVTARDGQATVRLEDAGYTVIRFRHDEPWEPIFAAHPSVFGAAT